MPDCTNAEIRDLLPDHAHGTLTGDARERVRAHLRACENCRDELELLHAVRALRPEPLAPDVSRIVAALPRPAAAPVRDAGNVVAIGTARPRARRAFPWAVAAGVAAVLVGVVGIGISTPPSSEPRPGATEATRPRRVAESLPASGPPAMVRTPRLPIEPPTGTVSEALGSLGGVTTGATDQELRALIEGLESLSGVPDADLVEGEAWVGAEDMP